MIALLAFSYTIRGGTLLFGFVNLTLVFLLVTMACVAVCLLSSRHLHFNLTWVDVAIIALATLMLVNSRSDAGLLKSLRFAVLVLVPYLLARTILIDIGQVRRFLFTLLAAITIISTGAFAYWVLPESVASFLPYQTVGSGTRLVFLEVNPIPMGIFYAVGIVLFTGLIPDWSARGRLLGFIMIGVLLFNTLTVGTRGSLVAAFGAICAAVVLNILGRNSKSIPTLFASLMMVAIVTFWAFLGAELFAIPNHERFTGLTSGDLEGLTARLELYSEAVSRFLESPIFGAGTAAMEIYAHNMFLETGAELGLAGLAILAALFGFVTRSVMRLYLGTSEDTPHYTMVATVFLVACALLIQKQLSTDLTHHKDLVVFTAIIVNIPSLIRAPGAIGFQRIRQNLPTGLGRLIPMVDPNSTVRPRSATNQADSGPST